MIGLKLSNVFNNDEYIDIYNMVKVEYSKSHRKYHNNGHILHMVTLLMGNISNFKLDDIQRDIIKTAIWFHDICYDIKNQDILNVLDSIDLFNKTVKNIEFFIDNPEWKDEICLFIESTINHKPLSVKNKKMNEIFLELDLAILGEESDIYDDYRKNIREEFSVFPDRFYNETRIQILRKLYEQIDKNGFNYLDNIYNIRAKNNISNEIVELLRNEK